MVRAGAALASLGALLALIAGIGRTALAMARNRDLPGWLAAVHPRHRVPHHAEVAVAAVVCALVAAADLRGVIGFSSFGVLVYYAVANASAFTSRRPTAAGRGRSTCSAPRGAWCWWRRCRGRRCWRGRRCSPRGWAAGGWCFGGVHNAGYE